MENSAKDSESPNMAQDAGGPRVGLCATLDEVEAQLRGMLAFIADAREIIEQTGTDPGDWDKITEVFRGKCRAAISFARIDLGKFILQINARVANMPLILADLADTHTRRRTPTEREQRDSL